MSLLTSLALALPESTFRTVWTDDTCSTEVAHTLAETPEWVKLPMFNALNAAIPGTFEIVRFADAWSCRNCGDAGTVGCHQCTFAIWK